jgi:hypothetical protein
MVVVGEGVDDQGIMFQFLVWATNFFPLRKFPDWVWGLPSLAFAEYERHFPKE